MKAVRELLNEIANDNSSAAVEKYSYNGLSEEQKKELDAKGVEHYAGKVRELVKDGDTLHIYHSDRLSAFDRYIGMVPFKGAILADISKFWLEETEKLMPTHFKSMKHSRVIDGEACTPVMAEVIVRGYMAGSMARAYEKGVREFCGVTLPEGLTNYCKLPNAIITPTTKAAAFEHDEDATPEELIESGVATKEQWAQIEEMALKLFAHGQKVYAEKGWILVDTKYEFGFAKDGSIKVIDEVHTPDSSRLWDLASYEEKVSKGEAPVMLDKENVRRYLLEQGFKGEGDVPEVPAKVLVDLAKVYLGVAEKLSGKELMVEVEAPSV